MFKLFEYYIYVEFINLLLYNILLANIIRHLIIYLFRNNINI